MLEVIGLTEAQESVYRDLVAGGPMDAAAVARRLGLPPDEVLDHLRVLEEHRLVTATQTTPLRYLAAPPDLVLEPVLLRHQQRVRAELDELTRAYRTARRRGDLAELVEVLVGEDMVLDRLRQLARTAQDEVLCLHRMPLSLPLTRFLEPEPGNPPRYRAIYDRATLEDPGLSSHVNGWLRRGVQARTLDRLPMRLVVGRGYGAVLPLRLGEAAPSTPASSAAAADHTAPEEAAPETALFIRPSALLETLVELFELLWELAIPLQPDCRSREWAMLDERAPSPDDLKLLSLMLAGLPDEAIARHLATSPRTITRRVRRLMDMTGTRTRFQLGCRISQRGWI